MGTAVTKTFLTLSDSSAPLILNTFLVTKEDTDMAGIEDLVNLGNLITQVRGQSQTTTQRGGTTRETTRTDVSDEGINELIRGILEGPGGVQNIGSAARSAGVYDSATEDLLLSNLYSRAAAQGELARSPTTRETETPDITTTQEIPGIGAGPLLGTLAATTLAAPLVDRASNFISGGAGAAGGGGGGITDLVSNLFSGGSSAGAAGTAGSAAGGAAAGGAGSFLTRSAGAAQGAARGALAGAGTQGAAVPGGFMSAVDTGGVGGGAGGVAAGATSFLGGLQGQRLSPVDVGSAIASGFAAGGPVGAGVAAIGTVFGNLLGGAVEGSVICTALMERGLLDQELYAKGAEYLAELDHNTVKGYHYWAVGVASKIRSGNKFATALCLPLARSRTSLLATSGTIADHIRHPLGTLTKFIGEPACWVIGKVLSARERIYG